MENNLNKEEIKNFIVQNKFKEADVSCEEFLLHDPNNEEVLLYSSIANYNLSNFQKSQNILQRLILINQKDWRVYYGLALSQTKLKLLQKADYNFKKAISLDPGNYQLLLDYGIFLSNFNAHDKARVIFEKLIILEPNKFIPFYNLGNCHLILGNFEKAINFFKRASKLEKDINPEILCSIGTAYERENNLENAKFYYKKAIDINPKLILAMFNLAIIEQNIGNFESSEKYLRKIISIDPYYGDAYRSLSLQKKFTINDPDLEQMEKIYDKTENKENKMFIGFAISKAYEDIKNFKKSSLYLKESNFIRRSQFSNYSINNEIKNFNNLKKIFNKEFYSKHKNSGFANSKPIFVLGMPRSGTTLVEQILSSHSKVSGAGELNYFSQSLNNHVDYKVADEMFRKIKLLNNETISLIGKNYVSYIDKLNFKTPYVVDKNPINFQLALLISVCLPQAKIIHCLRDPRDTCFSIFKNYFWQKVMPWSYNIDELTQFYKLYLDLMNFYHSIIDEDKILKLNYENLTLDPSNVTKQLIQFCGLEWEDQCLEFYKNKNTVKTASVRQVRNKIYKTSNKQWENYKDYLPDLFKNLP